MEDNKNYISLADLAKMGDENYLKMLKENKIKDLLKAIGLFSDYSITNDVLIISQMPTATCVKRMKEWNYYKRSVNKNEKALKVISHHIDSRDKDYTDKAGTVYTQAVEKLKTDMGYVFDISQTNGQEFAYLNSNKETVSKFFEAVKSALERTAKEYEFKYEDIGETSRIDRESKVVYIKDGMNVSDTINELISDVSKILLETRRAEGLSSEQKPNIDEIEHNSVIYAVHSKLGLDLPEFNFDEISKYNEVDQIEFKNNLQKVRSCTKQLLSNIESSIERAIRNLDKEDEKQGDKQAEKETPKVNEEQNEVAKPKRTRKTKQAESEVE